MITELPGESPEGASPLSSLDVVTRNPEPGRDGLPTTARPGSFLWTPVNVQRLIELAATKTVPEIARIMGISKNAIVGKAHRIGVSFPGFRLGCAEERLEIVRMILEGMRPSQIARALDQHVSTIHGKIEYIRKLASPPRKKNPTLADLGPDQCRFPLGGPKEPAREFCGEPVIEGKPYCGPHAARCFLKPSRDKGVPFHFEKMGTMAEILKPRKVEGVEL